MVTNQRVVITGATSGIGHAAALELARRGAALTIVCRNPERGRTTAAELEEAAGDGAVDVLHADLSELDQVRAVAQEVNDRYAAIDVLINNAGVQDLWPRSTSEGFDHMLASNYLGPFLLTNLVLDRVRAAPSGRVVTVASDAHRIAARINPGTFEQLGGYSGSRSAIRAYARTKFLDLLFSCELARRLDGSGATANACCPGLVATNLVEGGPVMGRADRVLTKTPLLRTPEQGARILLKLATDPSLVGVSGRYFPSTPGSRFIPLRPATRDRALQRKVWERTAALVAPR